MKKTAIILAAILSLAACNKIEDNVLIADHNTLYAQIEQETATKTYMDANNNIRWSEGDQIVGFMKSSLGLKYQILPSSVGKTYASFENISGSNGNINVGTEWDHNVVYYPYSDVVEAQKLGSNYSLSVSLPAEQTYAEDSFGNSSMAMVAVSEDNNITFKNILGGMKLQLKGTQTVKSIKIEGKNNEKLSGAAVVTAYTNNLAPAITITATDEASKSVTLNCGDGIQLSEGTATEFIIALPPVLFSQGFTLSVTDSNDETYTIETNRANTVLRSSILNMPAFILGQTPGDDAEDDDDELVIPVSSIELSSYSLKLYETYTANLTATIRPKDATDQTVVWSSDDPSVATVDQTGKVTCVSAGTATISAVAGGVVATCDVTVKELILVDYVDEYGVNHEKGVLIGGTTVWAPVNCGYKAATPTDKGYPYGKLYQWGRKYGQGYDENDASVPTFYEGGVSEVGGNHKNNENVFYIGYSDWVDTRNDKLWNSGTEDSPVKTTYDPCPTGWRVPTYSELKDLCQNYSAWSTNEASQSGRWFSGSAPYSEDAAQVFFPAAGYRSYSGGLAYSRGYYGDYWSSRPYNGAANHLFFNDGYAYMNSYSRASGYSVRCVQE